MSYLESCLLDVCDMDAGRFRISHTPSSLAERIVVVGTACGSALGQLFSLIGPSVIVVSGTDADCCRLGIVGMQGWSVVR